MTCRDSWILVDNLISFLLRLRPLSYTDTDMFILLCTLSQKDSLLNIRLNIEFNSKSGNFGIHDVLKRQNYEDVMYMQNLGYVIKDKWEI